MCAAFDDRRTSAPLTGYVVFVLIDFQRVELFSLLDEDEYFRQF